MLVQRVVMPVTGAESWTVVGDDGAVVAPVERYLAYLCALERSPNTVRAYAMSLRLWFEFLGQAGVGREHPVERTEVPGECRGERYGRCGDVEVENALHDPHRRFGGNPKWVHAVEPVYRQRFDR